MRGLLRLLVPDQALTSCTASLGPAAVALLASLRRCPDLTWRRAACRGARRLGGSASRVLKKTSSPCPNSLFLFLKDKKHILSPHFLTLSPSKQVHEFCETEKYGTEKEVPFHRPSDLLFFFRKKIAKARFGGK